VVKHRGIDRSRIGDGVGEDLVVLRGDGGIARRGITDWDEDLLQKRDVRDVKALEDQRQDSRQPKLTSVRTFVCAYLRVTDKWHYLFNQDWMKMTTGMIRVGSLRTRQVDMYGRMHCSRI